MEKTRSIKIVLLIVISILVTLLTVLDFLIPDPILVLDELGLAGGAIALWNAVGKVSKSKTKEVVKK